MKLLCTGDLHLGAGAELGRAPGDRLADQSEVLGRIAGIAVERDVDGILIAGDVFEGPGIPPEQLQLFAQFVAACHLSDFPILAITGNGKHDAAVRSTNGLAIFAHIPGIQISSTPELVEFAGCTVATLPWVHPGRYIAAHGRDVPRDETNSVVADLLLEAARGLRAQIPEEDTAILLAHWSVSGSNLPNGLPVADLREPVIDGGELADLGFDAVVLGHIHAPQFMLGDGTACTVIRGDGETPTATSRKPFYVGSPLPLNFGETGTGHGVWIVDLGASSTTFVPVESRPLVTLDYDWTTAADREPVAEDLQTEKVADAIVRVKYSAHRDQRIDNAEIRRQLLDAGAHMVKIVPDIVRADRVRVEGVDEQLGTMDALDLYLRANAIDPELAAAMRAKTTEYLASVA